MIQNMDNIMSAHIIALKKLKKALNAQLLIEDAGIKSFTIDSIFSHFSFAN